MTRFQTFGDGGEVDGYVEIADAQPVELPAAFTAQWDPPFSVLRSSMGVYSTDLDPTSLMPVTPTTLYVSLTGNNANTGLSPAQAFRDIFWAVISMDNALGGNPAYGPSMIIVEAGTYDFSHGFQGLLPGASSFSIIPDGGRVVATTSRQNLVWAIVGGPNPDVYQAALAVQPYAVVDLTSIDTASGLGERLPLEASIAAVQANPGSYFWAAGQLYVRTFDSRPPDVAINPFEGPPALAVFNLAINNAAVTAYVENVDFLGGQQCVFMNDGTRVVLNNCTMRYANDAGYQINSAVDSYAFNCSSQGNTADGMAHTLTSRALEVDCVSTWNGTGAPDTSNGSSMHDGGAIIRIGGVYTNNKGPNVVDVGGSKSLLFGARTSGTQAIIATQQVNYWCQGAGGLMWLVDCTAAANGVDVFADAGTVIKTLNTVFATQGGTGLIQTNTYP